MQRSVPIPSAGDAPFWEAAAAGRLLLQRCRESGRFQFYPRQHSLGAKAGRLEWVESTGRGVIETYTVTHRSFYADMPAPYVIAMVRLDEGVLIAGNMPGVDADAVGIGMRVVVVFEDVGPVRLPAFALDQQGPAS